MKTETKNKLLEALAYCNNKDKSTEFTLEYMQDFANVDLDCVVNFLKKNNYKLKIWQYQKRNEKK